MGSKIDFRARFVKSCLSLFKKLGLLSQKTKKSNAPSFLIVSTTGVGDTLWSTPALSALKKHHPNSKVVVLTSPLGYQVLLGNPHIDELICLKKGFSTLIFLFFRLRKISFEAIFIFHVSLRWIIPFCYVLNPNHLIGFDRHAKSFVEFLSQVHEVGLLHPILQRLSLIQSLYPQIKPENSQIKVYLKENERNQARAFLTRKALEHRLLIGLQPGASQLFKQWPIEHFIELALQLRRQYDCEFVVLGNAKELYLAQAIAQKIPVHIASGQLPLRVSCALIGQLDLLITNDTGPLHFALAQGVKTVSIFSPTSAHLCWPHQKAPWLQIIHRPKTCEPCIGHRCFKPYCMERIEPTLVLGSAQKLLNSAIEEKKLSKSGQL